MDIQIATITENLKNIRCPGTTFCFVSGLSSAQWSRAQAGIITLSGSEILRLAKLTAMLREIHTAAIPLVVDFKNLDAVCQLIKLYRDGQIMYAESRSRKTETQ